MRKSDRVNSTFLNGGRIAAGVVMVSRPTVLPVAMGVDPKTAQQIAFLPQMLGAREIGIGLGSIANRKQGRLWATVGVIADAGDLAAMILAVRSKTVKPVPGAGIGLVAAGATWIGVQGLLPHRAPKPVSESFAETLDAVAPRKRTLRKPSKKAKKALDEAHLADRASDLAATAKSRLDDAHLADKAAELRARLEDAHLGDKASDLASTARSRFEEAHLSDKASDLASTARSRFEDAHLGDRASDLASTARTRFEGLNLQDRFSDLSGYASDLSSRASDLTAKAQKTTKKQSKKQKKAAEKAYDRAYKKAVKAQKKFF